MITPDRSLPPKLFALGVSPSQAASWRPDRIKDASDTAADIADAVIGPTPGIVASLWLVSSVRCHAMICTFNLSISLVSALSGVRFHAALIEQERADLPIAHAAS